MLCREFVLFNYLGEHKDRKNNADQRIQANYGTNDGEKNTDNRDLCQQADNRTAYHADNHMNNEGNNERIVIGGLESEGEERFEHIHSSTSFM